MMTTGELFDLGGKVALVTGGGAGLGRMMVRTLTAAGARVMTTDIDGERAEETRAIVEREHAGRCVAATLDVTDSAAVAALVQTLADSHGGLDILVNSAGIAVQGRRVHELSDADWNSVIGANLTGTFNCCRAAIPHMLTRGGGSIITIASIIGVVGAYPGFPMITAAYGASKAGVIGLTRQIAVEYAADGIRANAIAPGWHGGTRLAERYRGNLSNSDIDRFESAIVEGTPMKRRGTPDELQGLVLYLASGASSFLTGQVIVHDGGWTVQ